MFDDVPLLQESTVRRLRSSPQLSLIITSSLTPQSFSTLTSRTPTSSQILSTPSGSWFPLRYLWQSSTRGPCLARNSSLWVVLSYRNSPSLWSPSTSWSLPYTPRRSCPTNTRCTPSWTLRALSTTTIACAPQTTTIGTSPPSA